MRLWLRWCASAIEVTPKSIHLPPPNSVTAVLITRSSQQGKRKVNVCASKRTSFAPPPRLSDPWLWAKAIFFVFFFFPFLPSLKRWNRRRWMMDRCAGIVLFCSALKEIIDLHYGLSEEKHNPSHTNTHTPLSHPTVRPIWLHHLPPGSSPLLIKEWAFISLPAFYRGGVFSLACSACSPAMTWVGKLSRLLHKVYKPAQTISKPYSTIIHIIYSIYVITLSSYDKKIFKATLFWIHNINLLSFSVDVCNKKKRQ